MAEGFLPPVVVELLAKTSEFKAAIGEAGLELERFETRSSKALAGAAHVGKAALFGIAGAAAVVGVASIEMADKYEVSHARLEAALKGAGSSFEDQKKQIDGVSKSMEDYGFTNTQTEDALAGMTVALHSPKTAMDDLGLAADLARMKNISLAQAGILVAKASEGQTRPLRALGIDLPVAAGGAKALKAAQDNLTGSQQKLTNFLKIHKDALDAGSKSHSTYLQMVDKVDAAHQKLTETQQAGTKTLDALKERLAGQAQTAAETFGGKVNHLKVQMEDLGIKIGMWLIPKLESLVTHIMSIINWFERHSTVAKALGIVIGTVLVGAITAYIAQLVIAAARSAASFVKMIAQGVAWAASQAASLAETTALWTMYFAEWVARQAAAAAEFLAAQAAMLAESAASAAAWVATQLAEVASVAAGWIASLASMAVAAAAWAAEMVVAGAAALLPFAPIILAVAAVGIAAYELYKHWDQVWGLIKGALAAAWSFIKQHFTLILTVALGPLGFAIAELARHWDQVWGAIKSVLSDTWGSIKTIFNAIVHGGLWYIKTEINALKTVWSTVWDGIQATVQGVWGVIKPILEAIKNAVSKVTGGVSGLAHAAGGVLSHVPGFADGGRVPGAIGSPMLAVVHGGEYVVSNAMQEKKMSLIRPMLPWGNGPQGRGGGGGDITIITPVYLDGHQVAKVVTPHVRDHMLKAGRGMPNIFGGTA